MVGDIIADSRATSPGIRSVARQTVSDNPKTGHKGLLSRTDGLQTYCYCPDAYDVY
jgi:hypothetical protein